MGLFDKLFKSKQADSRQMNSEKRDFSYVSEIAGLITGNDSGLMKSLNEFLFYTQKDCEEDLDFEYWAGMVDELEEEGYLISVDYKCELEDFLWALSQIKNYSLIESAVCGLKLDENQNADVWGEQINLALNGEAFVCMIEIDSDSYELIVVTADVYEKISFIAKANGHSIEDFKGGKNNGKNSDENTAGRNGRRRNDKNPVEMD